MPPPVSQASHALPSLYLSHGSPMIAIEPSVTSVFLRWLGPFIEEQFGRPRAVLAISPHTATSRPTLFAGPRHHAIHDFSGFPQALYDIEYDAPGDPHLALHVEALLGQAGIEADVIGRSGLDHGIWTILHLMWPQADIPVVPLSLVPFASPREQWKIGAALSSLRQEGVLIMASGSLTHNLHRVVDEDLPLNAPEDPGCAAFRHWVWERCRVRDWTSLFDYTRLAPSAAAMHPSDEHWLPFFIAAGAGGADAAAVRIHAGVEHGALAMDAYAFGKEALALQIE